MNQPEAQPVKKMPQSPPRPSRWPARLAMFLVCIAGGSIGYFATRPLYRGEGLIRFRQPSGALHDELSRPIDSQYLESEALTARSRTIVEFAMRGSNWNAVGRPVSPASKEWFATHLDARPSTGGTISISFLDPDPNIAGAACKAATLAYSDYWTYHHDSIEGARLAVLRDRVSLIFGTVTRLDDQILKASSESGGMDLTYLHHAQIDEMLRLERQVQEAQAPAAASTKPTAATDWLLARYEKAKEDASRTGTTLLRVEEFRRQREQQAKELETLQKRIGDLTIQLGMASSLSILTTGDVSLTPAIDHRWRNALMCAVASLLLFLILKILLRKWRNRYRVITARTAFPTITHMPKPVVAISEGAQVVAFPA